MTLEIKSRLLLRNCARRDRDKVISANQIRSCCFCVPAELFRHTHEESDRAEISCAVGSSTLHLNWTTATSRTWIFESWEPHGYGNFLSEIRHIQVCEDYFSLVDPMIAVR